VDALQPDPLYQRFMCIESGGLAVDVPNGNYRVFVNIDSPGGFWGENQTYRERSILAQGKKVVSEKLDFATFRQKYFHFWDTEDLPTDNVFEKYGSAHFKDADDLVDALDELHLRVSVSVMAGDVTALPSDGPIPEDRHRRRYARRMKRKHDL